MEYTFNNINAGTMQAEELYNYSISEKENLLTRFLRWCNAQEKNHYFWLAAILFGQVGAMLPIAIYTILFFGANSLVLWIIVLTVNLPNLILNLASLPTKFTLPALFFSLFTEVVIVAYCLVLTVLH